MWGQIAAAVASGLASLYNTSQQNKANEANIAMQRETNAMNYKIWEQTRDWNAPRNMVNQMRLANVNPISAYGGLASSAKISPMEMESAKIAPAMFDADSIINSVNQTRSAAVADEQAKQLKIENGIKETQLKAELDKTRAQTKNIENSTVVDSENLGIAKQKVDLEGKTVNAKLQETASLLQLQAAELGNKQIQNRILQLDEQLKSVELKYSNPKSKAEVYKLNAETARIQQEIKKLFTQTGNEQINQSLLSIEQMLAARTLQTNVDFANARLVNERIKPYITGANAINNIFKTGSQYFKK